MTKVEIIALAQKWEAFAVRADARYQESGLARHLREKEQAEDMADALRIAANAADDHGQLISLRGSLNALAVKAHAALDALESPDRASDEAILRDLASNVLSWARLYGLDSELPASRKYRPDEA